MADGTGKTADAAEEKIPFIFFKKIPKIVSIWKRSFQVMKWSGKNIFWVGTDRANTT